MSVINRLKLGVKALVERHGSEVGACAKIAASALLPGGGILVESVGVLCDYASDQSQALSDERIMHTLKGLESDHEHLAILIENLGGRLDDVLAQMIQMSKFKVPEDGLRTIVNTALAHRRDLSELRNEMLMIQPKLSFVQTQNESLLKGQAFAGDMLIQMKSLMEVMLSYVQIPSIDGLRGQQSVEFITWYQRFHIKVLEPDLNRAREALREMKRRSPNGDTVKVAELYLCSLEKNFEGAQKIASNLSVKACQDVRLTKLTRTLTTLTQASTQDQSTQDQSAQDQSAQDQSTQDQSTQDQSSQGTAVLISKTKAEDLSTPFLYKVNTRVGSRGWRLISILGRGGMGAVWRAQNSRGQEGALKLMSKQLSGDPLFVRRFQSEIDALDKITHPNIVDILDWGEDRHGAWYVVMSYIQGVNLRTKIDQELMTSQETKALGRALASGLIACHAKGITHRDIKPENIMLRHDNTPILIDFGIAHQEGDGTGKTILSGTVRYAPPEQHAGEKVGPEADIYALAVTLADCMGGVKALKGEWVELISRLTLFNPAQRGTASELFDLLSDDVAKYFLGLKQKQEGPLKVSEVVECILNGGEEAIIWAHGLKGWVKWSEVQEIKERVDALRQQTTSGLSLRPQLTPPPMPTRAGLEIHAQEVSKERERAAHISEIKKINPHLTQTLKDYEQYQNTRHFDRDEVIKSMNRLSKWKRATEDECIEGYFLVAKCYHNGLLVNANTETAKKYYLIAAKAGHALSQTNYGNLCSTDKESLKWFKRGAQGGSYAGAYNASQYYMNGRGTPVDFKEAIRYQKMAVECLRKKVSNIEDWDISVSDYQRYQESTRDEREEVLKSIGRFQTWLRAADTTCPEACFLVGKCYNMGILTSKNSQRARSYYLKGAKHGDAFCQANYGSMMRELEWYEIAAHGGSYAGAYNAMNHYDGKNSQKERYYRRLMKRNRT